MSEDVMPNEEGVTQETGTGTGNEQATESAPTTLLGGDAPNDGSTAGATTGQDGDARDAAGPTETVVPDTYTLQLRDGFALDEQGQREVDTFFHGMNLSAEQGQKLADEYMRRVEAMNTQTMAVQREQAAKWADESARDSEFGGPKFRENLGYSADAMKRFGTPQLRALLNQSGMGNHPELVRFFYRVGKALRQDSLVTGSQAGKDKTLSELMYPSMKDLPNNGYSY